MAPGNKFPLIYDLEAWLYVQDKKEFPTYNEENEKSFPERYKDLKTKLGAIHDQVEKGAVVNSFIKEKDNLKEYFRAQLDNGNENINIQETIDLLEN